MEVPVTLKMLYRQRKRWAKGGTEVWLTNFKKVMLHPFKHIGRTIIFIEYCLVNILLYFRSFFCWINRALCISRKLRTDLYYFYIQFCVHLL